MFPKDDINDESRKVRGCRSTGRCEMTKFDNRDDDDDDDGHDLPVMMMITNMMMMMMMMRTARMTSKG